jgi:hypothetical protein
MLISDLMEYFRENPPEKKSEPKNWFFFLKTKD